MRRTTSVNHDYGESTLVRALTKTLQLKVDPELAALFEGLTGWTYEALKKDIKQNGIKVPLVIAQDGTIVCGHQRYKIANELGFEKIPYIIKQFKEKQEMIDYAVKDNILRRQLNTYCKGLVGLKLLEHEEAEAKNRKGKRTDLMDETSVKSFTEVKGRAEEKAAKIVGISHTTLHKIKYVEAYGSHKTKRKAREGGISVQEAWVETRSARAPMSELKGLITLGKNIRGYGRAHVQLEGDIAYLTNSRRSILFKTRFHKVIGYGTFYAREVPSFAELIERGGCSILGKRLSRELVRIEWLHDNGVQREALIPDKRPFAKKAERAIKKYYREPNITVSSAETLCEVVDNDITFTRLESDGNNLKIRQIRSDGSVQLRALAPATRESGGEIKTGEVSVWTRDLVFLKFMVGPFELHLKEHTPVSIKGRLKFNADLMGIIAHAEYDD